jgi:GT2 family glycosyltransferase
MKPLLMIMNPREIPQCMTALEALDIDKVWLKNWTERELVSVIAEVIDSTDHDVIGLLSDDTIPNQGALDLVLDSFEPSAVFTGYCNMDEGSPEVNLSKSPLIVKEQASLACYNFPSQNEVDNHDGLYRSWFTGFAMTFMSKHFWQRYPFDCVGTPGYQSDYRLSVRLQQDEIPIWAVPGAFMPHLRFAESTKHLQGGTVLTGNGRGKVVWDI